MIKPCPVKFPALRGRNTQIDLRSDVGVRWSVLSPHIHVAVSRTCSCLSCPDPGVQAQRTESRRILERARGRRVNGRPAHAPGNRR